MPDEWVRPVGLPKLEAGELQLWRVDLADEDEAVEEEVRWLTGEERERAGRLRAGGPRTRFVAARASLRVLLGEAMGVKSREVQLRSGPAGKPEVNAAVGQAVSFNVSHCRATILIGMARRGRVGVDVEAVDRRADVMGVAEQAFTPEEAAAVAAADSERARRLLFFRGWTRKEAVVKAEGYGLLRPLRSFTVPLGEARDMPVMLGSWEQGRGGRYLVSNLEMDEAMAAAYAVDCELRPQLFRVPFSTLSCGAGGRQ